MWIIARDIYCETGKKYYAEVTSEADIKNHDVVCVGLVNKPRLAFISGLLIAETVSTSSKFVFRFPNKDGTSERSEFLLGGVNEAVAALGLVLEKIQSDAQVQPTSRPASGSVN